MRRAFVSHSTADDSFVAEMESFLRAAGFDDVFNDVHAIEPDEQFWQRIEQGLTDCDAFVVVITAAATNSEWVKREVALARRLGKRVIPVWREDCPLPPDFSDRDVIDFRPRTRKERRFDIARIVKYAPAELIGRESETSLLTDAWQKTLRLEKGRPHVLTFVAVGGEGKTSLVAKWAAELACQDWPGCDAAFAWSFYSQGTREQLAASSDLFLKEALTFFGDEALASSAAGAYEKGRRLAQLVGERRALLILDGLEPLQYAPSSPTPGELKDQGLAALLKGLAAASHGQCIVTTRYSLPDLKAFWQTTAPERSLVRLSKEAGVHLLQKLRVRKESGTKAEFEKLVEDVKGHALTLTLLGRFLRDAHGGDIRKRDLVRLEEADKEEEHGHAFRVMDAYVKWFLSEGERGHRGLAVLRCLGLFDRPATADCLAALQRSPGISGMTKSLVGLSESQRNLTFARLESAKLLTVNRDATGTLLSLDAHPLVRVYFAHERQVQHLEAWRAAHRRLYEHLCASTPDKPQPTLEDLQPLYQAVAHGCQAALQEDAWTKVYVQRINHGERFFYSIRKLGAFGSDLGALGCFFEVRWRQPATALSPHVSASLLGIAAFELRAVGRVAEAIEPTRASLEQFVRLQDWQTAAKVASNLSELELTLGDLASAVGNAERCLHYAKQDSDWSIIMIRLARLADALHQVGRRVQAEAHFREAEQMQKNNQRDYPTLYSWQGFAYCDLLLAAPERAAWESQKAEGKSQNEEHLAVCRAVSQRVARTLKWVEGFADASLLDSALDHLTLGRAALYEAILTKSEVRSPKSEVEQAVSGLRRAGQQDELPKVLLTRAWLRFLTGERIGPESAQADLDEAWEIAERGPMRLQMADIHLYRARLFFREKQYPWESPAADLADAEKLVNDCGYHRRDEELADAKRAILGA